MKNSAYIIECQNVHKNYTNGPITTSVLRGVSFRIARGEFLAITGRSGAGKSTLLYQLSGLDQPTWGTILVNGEKISEFSEHQLSRFRLRTLGYVFQDYALVPELNMFENVLLPLLMRGLSWSESESIANEALATVNLEHRMHNLPSQLSGGEQQRVAIARAIAGKPQILFADEPTANLDSASGRSVIELLKKLHQSGQTIVMVTHEDEYTTACDRILQLEDGVVVGELHKQQPTTAAARENSNLTAIIEPATPYVNPLYTALRNVQNKNND